MKCLVLAAGYATRLYPLTENFPKPLLKVGGVTIVDRLIDDIDSCGKADEFIVVTNSKFESIFRSWAAESQKKITVIADGTFTNETRLGAVMDIQLAVETLNITEDTLIIAGDNLLDFSLTEFISYAEKKKTSCTMRYFEQDINVLRKSGISEVGSDDLLISFEEKPENPKSNWCTPPFYYYTGADIIKIKDAISEGCGVDAPGSLVSWMCRNSAVHSMEMPGKRYDIGDIKSYEEAEKNYHGFLYIKNNKKRAYK